MRGFPLDSSAIFKHYERKSLIMPDRQKESAAAWMKTHPEITHVSRDRSSEYASAMSSGAPQAMQVADRFHVAKNLSEAVQQLLGRVLLETKTASQGAEGATQVPRA